MVDFEALEKTLSHIQINPSNPSIRCTSDIPKAITLPDIMGLVAQMARARQHRVQNTCLSHWAE